MENSNSFSRRRFLRNTSVGTAGIIVAPTILKSCAPGTAPSDRIRIAHIGTGSRGQGELKSYFVPNASSYSVATCDPFKQRRDSSAEYITQQYKELGVNGPGVKSYLDFEEILERDDVDAVHIVTPDHWHVPIAIKAARAGKHVYLAKPLGLSYPNFKILEKAMVENDVRFQYGTQQRGMRHLQAGIDMIKEGLIGEIEKVSVWAPGKINEASPVCNEAPVPKDFDYDRFVGPAPLRPYCPERVTTFGSWFQWDFAIGFLAGWGAHPLDVLVWGVKEKLEGKYSIEGTGELWEPGGLYNTVAVWDMKLLYETGFEVTFKDTDSATADGSLEHLGKDMGDGTTFYGSKGWISLSRGFAESNIPELNQKLLSVMEQLPRNKWGFSTDEGNYGSLFADVVNGKIPEVAPLREAILSDTISHMSNIAIREGQKITWDPVAGEVVDNPEAMTKWFTRDLREPYTL